MMNKHVKHEHGLAAVIGAFAAAFCLTAFPAIELNGQVVNSVIAIQEELNADDDRDGISNEYDKVLNKQLWLEDVLVVREEAEAMKAAAAEAESAVDPSEEGEA